MIDRTTNPKNDPDAARGSCRRFSAVVGFLLLALVGCTQTCLRPECDWKDIYVAEKISPRLEEDPTEALIPVPGDETPPPTVADPERPPRFLSLQEAFALALENGTVGQRSIQAAGLVSEDLFSIAGRGAVGSDAVRVLALQPAITEAGVEAALSRFDPILVGRLSWTETDQPTQGFANFQNGAGANFATTLAKPLATGGVAGITFGTDYRLLANPPTGLFSVVNPSWTPRWQVGFEQPLLRGGGVYANQVLPTFGGSTLFPEASRFLGTAVSEGILITRLRADQQRVDFERSIQFQVLNVEAGYWNLYGAYVDLYAAEQGLRQAHAAWNLGKKKYDVGALNLAQFALLRAQYETFRAERLQALSKVLERERNLRVLLGLPVQDGQRLVPVDSPFTVTYRPHWQASLRDCLMLRPELVQARQEIQARRFRLDAAKNALMPDLRFQASYGATGLGTRLDGSGTRASNTGGTITNNALRSLWGDHFNDWNMGLTLNIPLGYRAEHAAVRQARLELTQSFLQLRDSERQAQIVLAAQYNRVIETGQLIDIRRQARKALAEQLEVRFRQFVLGDKNSTLEFLLDAQKQWAQALSQEYQAIVNYNIALASFEFVRGTLLQRNKVVISEGPLPQCAQVRAVEHERECTKAHVLREKARPVVHPPLDPTDLDRLLPTWPGVHAPTVPALLAGAPAVPLSLEGAAPKTNLALELEDAPIGNPAAESDPAPTPQPVLLPPQATAPPAPLPPGPTPAGLAAGRFPDESASGTPARPDAPVRLPALAGPTGTPAAANLGIPLTR